MLIFVPIIESKYCGVRIIKTPFTTHSFLVYCKMTAAPVKHYCGQFLTALSAVNWVVGTKTGVRTKSRVHKRC